jgi:uncharacterized membrane protein YhaH (DUF805 family)
MRLLTKRENHLARLTSSYRHNLGNLARFAGRDTKTQFWPWAITVFLIAYGSSIVIMGTAMAEATFTTMRAARGEIPSAKAAQAVSDLGWLWKPLALIATAAVILLAASVARRLHDVGWRAGWGVVPLPFLAASIAYTSAGFRYAASESEPEPPISAIVSAPLFYITLIALIVVLARKGQIESNRFGPAVSG